MSAEAQLEPTKAAAVAGLADNSPVNAVDSGNSLNEPDDIVTVYFVQSGRANAVPSETISSDGWTQYEIDQAMAALNVISNYIDLEFVFSTDPNADFQWVLDDDGEIGGQGNLGFHYQPPIANYNGDLMGAFNANGYGWSTLGLLAGGLGFSTMIHEALHGLGLDHPHDGETILPGLVPDASPFGVYGDYDLNQGVYTIMSYNDGLNGDASLTTGNAATPMALDIAALQALYGANTTHNSGGTTYTLSGSNAAWICIWDTGGTDLISYGGSGDAKIDLREATLEQGYGGGGFLTMVDGVQGGYTIAAGAIIENATSGSGDDVLIGNAVNNVLTASGGNDTVYGGAGHDTINTGSGTDTAYGESGNDTITSDSGTNTIYGSSGQDVITGGTGVDTIHGGGGDDTILGLGSGDTIYGGRGDDEIDGGSGNDFIFGGRGADDLTGGTGADTFVFEFASDSAAGNGDTIQDFVSGTDKIDLSALSDSLIFINTAEFNNVAGEVRFAGGTVQIDLNGDGNANMEIDLTGVGGLSASDFIL